MAEDTPQNPGFLDVPTLLDRSHPRARHGWLVPVGAALLVLILGSTYLTSRSPGMKLLVDGISGLLMVVVIASMAVLMFNAVRRQREERTLVETIEEMVQLRRWPQAAGMLQLSLSRPALTAGGRIQMLIFLCTVLGRYGRFADAITVQNYLLDEVELDPSTQHALQLGRAMAMLREDHLVDADREINDLRRNVSRVSSIVEQARREQTVEVSESDDTDRMVSGGLALIEMYRDVKTGHASEAIELFNRALPTMRKQLGIRTADAYALAAKAMDFSNDVDRARVHWEQATLLAAPQELIRRYPELAGMMTKYAATPTPPEMTTARSEAA